MFFDPLSLEQPTIVRQLMTNSRVFYRANQRRLLSIMLFGSIAHRKNRVFNDADICGITRFSYDFIIGNRLERFLQKQIPKIKINVGVLPLARLTSHLDKSHYLYDLKYNSLVIAGADYRSQIQEIGVNDFYPFEGFLLILNRSVDLIRSIRIFEPQQIVLDEELFKVAAARIQRAYVDSMLIFDGFYHPNYDTRLRMFVFAQKTSSTEDIQ